jgi:hypothetical protein
MGDAAPTASLLERLTPTDWDRLGRELEAVAARLGASAADGEELAAEIITRACAEGSKARAETDLDALSKLLGSQLSNLHRTQRRKRARRKTDLNTDRVEAAPPSSDRNPERRLLDRDRALRYLGRLKKRLANTRLPLRILAIYEGGILGADQLIEATGEKPDAVYHARRVILEAVRALLAEGSDPDVGANESP